MGEGDVFNKYRQDLIAGFDVLVQPYRIANREKPISLESNTELLNDADQECTNVDVSV